MDNLKLTKRMISSTNDIISEIKIEILRLYMDIHKLYEKDIDEIHLINNEIKKNHDSIKTKLKKDI